jgi:hypothetical protein
MLINKCHYYNNAQTACTLMIDDLAQVAVTSNGTYFAGNDWGYGLDSENSIWKYFERNLLDRYPEIKGTFFFATQTYAVQNKNAGYIVLKRGMDKEFRDFVKRHETKFELAFHGTTHGSYIDQNSPELAGNFLHEFEFIDRNDLIKLQKEISKYEEFLKLQLKGGKYCGYKKNEYADEIIEKLGFKWWSSSAEMIGRKHVNNRHTYFGSELKVLDFPTNVPGNLFNQKFGSLPIKMKWLKFITRTIKNRKNEQYLQYLYENGLIISIQEHFQNQRTDGKRQSQNVYDDILSLDKIFGILHGADIWYATCSEIAHYLESYDNTDIIIIDESTFKIKYRGRWEKPFLSINTKSRIIKNIDTGKTYHGIYKNGLWVYNYIEPGVYKLILNGL